MKQSNFRLIRLALFSTCSVPFLAVAAPALAQSAPQEASNSDQQMGEIVVSAQRRSELARDVPISITALSGESLSKAGVTDISALQTVTPGLRMEKVGNFVVPAIRGITTTVTGPGADPNVAIYVDGVYQPESTANTFDLPDIERVEVLKGPQGTLFGRNATAGAIQVITKVPGNTTEGSFSGSFASFNDLTVKGFVSTPLIENRLAISLAGYYRHANSYYVNIGAGERRPEGLESKLIRAKLRFTPTDNLSILLTGLYSDRYDLSTIVGSAYLGNTSVRVTDPTALIPTQPWTFASDFKYPYQRTRTRAVSGKIDLDLGSGTLTSLSAYSYFKNVSLLDADYGQNNNGTFLNYAADTSNRAFSEELTYASHSQGPVNYSLGLFYVDGWGGWDPLGLRRNTPPTTFSANLWGHQKYTSWAGFGEIYFKPTDKLTLILGGRYSWEKRREFNAFDFSLVYRPPLTFIGEKSWSSFTPRASIKYDLTPTSNVYFTFSKGFKSGIFNTQGLTNVQLDGSPPYSVPETLYNYEVGFKGRVADWLNLTADAFYYDYKNPQVNFYRGFGTIIFSNGKRAELYGAEFDANFRFGRHFDARASVTYVHSKYTDFPQAGANSPILGTNGLPTLTGNNSVNLSVTGKPMLKAPKLSAYATATYHADVAGGTLDLTGSIYHSSKVYHTFDYRIVQPAYETFDASIAWTPENGKFTISAFGRNLSNEAVLSGVFVNADADGVSYAPPRTYGVQLDVRF